MAATASGPAAALRGVAAGALTAALTIAAHGVAGRTPPVGAVAAQLVLLAAAVGAVAATAAPARHLRALIPLLGAGQLLGHALLAAADHHSGHLTPAMVTAHLAAVAVGAVLIITGDRLCSALSRMVRITTGATATPVPAAAPTARCRAADHPRHSSLLLTASISHRGPPVRS